MTEGEAPAELSTQFMRELPEQVPPEPDTGEESAGALAPCLWVVGWVVVAAGGVVLVMAVKKACDKLDQKRRKQFEDEEDQRPPQISTNQPPRVSTNQPPRRVQVTPKDFVLSVNDTGGSSWRYASEFSLVVSTNLTDWVPHTFTVWVYADGVLVRQRGSAGTNWWWTVTTTNDPYFEPGIFAIDPGALGTGGAQWFLLTD